MAVSRFQRGSSENNKGHSSAVASVLFDKGGDNRVEITKGGSYVYWGTPGDFYEWEFRTRLRAKAAGKDDEKYADMMGKIIEGLRGEAFVVAKELGLDALWNSPDDFTEGGVDNLIRAVKLSVFPNVTHEAKELFTQFSKASGPLSRQNGESMQHYISRRVRCWKLLTELDEELMLSEHHRADLLLDLAGLNHTQRTMIQASIGNERDFNKIAEALRVQHPKIHLARPSSQFKGGGGKGRKGKSKYHKRNPFNFANIACEWEQQDEWAAAYLADYDVDEPYNDPAHEEDENAMYYYHDTNWSEEWYEEEEVAYVAEEWQVDDAYEAAELNCVALMFESLGDDCIEKDPERCASFMKDGTCAFMASNKGSKGKGKGKGKKGKRKISHQAQQLVDRRPSQEASRTEGTFTVQSMRQNWPLARRR